MNKPKRRHELRGDAADTFGRELAWKRAGFKDYDALAEYVRKLPMEEKINMLVELHMRELAAEVLDNKMAFLRKLGKKTWVDREEVLEYIYETYTGTDNVEWIIHESNFHSYWVDPDKLYADRAFGCELTEWKKELEGNKK